MKKYSLDTSFIIEFLRGNEDAGKFYQDLEDSSSVFIPSLAEVEAKRGISNIGKFEQLETQEFGSREVEISQRVFNYLENQGRLIGKLDILIASIAISNSSILVTFDEDFHELKEFEGFEAKIIDK